MPKLFFFSALCLLLFLSACSGTRRSASRLDADTQIAKIEAQYRGALQNYSDLSKFPRTIKADGSLAPTPSWDWTTGFFPAILWELQDYRKDAFWKEPAQKWLTGLEKEQFNKGTHDLGFMMYCPFGVAYKQTNDPKYRDILIQSAKSLATRYNPTVKSIKSWDFGKWKYAVIIDNMMNLELLFWATQVTGDSTYHKIAVQHAETTIRNHFRADNSSYHVIDYDPQTGNIVGKKTHQGFADESAWARGQSWGLYGFVSTYRWTKNPRYLAQAIKIADFLRQHPNLPADKVPYWDYNAPNIPNEERDASAAAIMASALLELSQYVENPKRKEFMQLAEQILITLSSPAFQAETGTNGHFMLKHSVGSKPGKVEVDVPLVYADYYYLEALKRYKKMMR